MDDLAVAELRAADLRLAAVIDEVGTGWLAEGHRPDDVPRGDHFAFLVRAIAGQQLSTRAASAIFTRLRERFGGSVPTPGQLLADDPEQLRVAAGLSHAKLRYMRALAAEVADGRLALDALDGLDDDAVRAQLTAVTGIGPWVASLFLMFELRRPDVVAGGDLGIRQAVKRAYGLEVVPTIAETEATAEAWRPHRTLACEFLWRSLRVKPV
jgi:DNA-3-methyladenine glycosylase II